MCTNDLYIYIVPNSDDDDVIINYITNMYLGEDSDSHYAFAESCDFIILYYIW